ncbi:MAG: DNA polymerase III subunit beta [Candidatus Kerfeldbacteria bacterium]|nr:DNA polymerase III subunit beta [Candidatus Kerfeldbacteria bacterium]
MKFTCTQENLSRGLNAVGRVASKNLALPILNNVLIVAEGGVVKLQATNLELGTTTIVRAKIDQPGRYTVPAKLLGDFVNFLGHEQIHCQAKENGLTIVSGHSTTTIRGISAEEFPVMPTITSPTTVTLPARELATGLEGVVFAVANDESRPEISGVFIRAQDKKLVLAATDSYRLAERRLDLLQGEQNHAGVIVPARTAQELLRVLPQSEAEVKIAIGDNQIQINFDELELVSRIIEGHYPDYEQIIPKTWATTIVVDHQEFLANTKAASLFCQPGINDLTLEADEKQLALSAANSQQGEHRATLSAKVTGPKTTTVFNYRYLLDGIQGLAGDEIQLQLNDGQAPGLLQNMKQVGALYLIMPIRQ